MKYTTQTYGTGHVVMADGTVRDMTEDESAAYKKALERSMRESREYKGKELPAYELAAAKWAKVFGDQ